MMAGDGYAPGASFFKTSAASDSTPQPVPAAGPVLEVAQSFHRPHVDTALRKFTESPHLWTTELLVDALDSLSRFEAPAFISELDAAVGLPVAELRPIVARLYSYSGYPLLCLSESRWFELFKRVGYTVDGEAAERPAGPVQLWRGALPDFRANWSWTSSRGMAAWVAKDAGTLYAQGTQHGALWTAAVEPWRVLGRVSAHHRDGELYDTDAELKLFHEYIVYTEGLTITEDTGQGLGVNDASRS